MNGVMGGVMSAETTLEGTVQRVRFAAADGFAVIVVRDAAAVDHVVRGRLPAVQPGDQLRVTGRRTVDARYGEQLAASEAAVADPVSADGLVAVLSGLVTGVGRGLARRFVEACQDVPAALSALDGSLPWPVVAGLREEAAKRLQEAWQARREERALDARLASLGLGPALRARVRATYQKETAHILATDPYRLAQDVDGIGFSTADSVARQAGIGATDPRRYTAAFHQVLQDRAQEGHTRTGLADLRDGFQRLLGHIPPGVVQVKSARELEAAGRLVVDRKKAGSPTFALPVFARAEARIAAQLRARAQGTQRQCHHDFTIPEEINAGLSDEQRAAIFAVATHGLLVLTGGPGVGKSYTTKAIVRLWESQGLKMALAAPTGRAARRLSEATGRPAVTIHRLLEYGVGGAQKFTRNADCLLTEQALILDESSMVDVLLLDALLDALPPDARIVFVGDVDQLPPVGPGAPFRDLIEASVMPVVRLREVHRQAQGSAIVRASHATLRGELPDPSKFGDRSPGTLFLLPRADAAEAARAAVDVAARVLPSWGITGDIQCIAPMKKGDSGTYALNEGLQHRINPAEDGKAQIALKDRILRVGDRVMQMRNDYSRGVMNGEIGRVSAAYPDAPSTETCLLAEFDGQEHAIEYKRDELQDLHLAYCCTVHKLQGCEARAIVLVLTDAHYIMLSRMLLYTAITRARDVCIIIGSPKALQRAVENARVAPRHTALREILLE